MSTPSEPTRSACFQPENYEDLELFADRTALGERLTMDLESYLRPGGPGRARILVRGQRGVGKSILTRRALNRVARDFCPLLVTVDAQITDRGSDEYMRKVAGDLAREAIENADREEIRSEAELLARFAAVTKVTSTTVKDWNQSLKLGAGINLGFQDHVKAEFGLTRTVGRSRKLEEKHEITIDSGVLREMIQRFIRDCSEHDQTVVLFLDNLDQVGYAEREEEVREVLNLARLLINLSHCVVVANLRNEFVSRDLRKQHSQEFPVEGMSPEELVAVADTRMQQAGDDQRAALARAGFRTIAETLAQWTDNAWGYLTWLAHLDYEPLDCAADDANALRDVLKATYVPTRFYDLQPGELDALAEAYTSRRSKYLSVGDLTDCGVDDDLVRRSVYYSALIPDWLLSPERYILSPCLHFIVDP